ncbi:hypothetical protein KIW84_012704 [Lathyrus oleraceus]|uniref:Uncharacterized protein n=1 Tax=Pisum sativum TaxID=3888 RepID=A0A9D5GWQ0_PEA|nr:hypothetical protein KIW84_012704 [Pisum sativum]
MHTLVCENPAARAITILLVRCWATVVDGECEQDILIRFQTRWSNIFPSNFKIDLLENSAIDDVVVLSIVLEEVKNKNMSVYNRLRAICSNSNRKFFVFSNEYHRDTYVKEMSRETKSDKNGRAIRVATQYGNTCSMLWALSSCIGQKSCLGCVCLRSSTARSQWILGVVHSFAAYSPCVATLRFLGVGLVERSFSNCGQELRNPEQGLPQYYRHSRGTSLVLHNATLSCNGDYRGRWILVDGGLGPQEVIVYSGLALYQATTGYVNPALHKTEINIKAMENGKGVQSVANLASYLIKNFHRLNNRRNGLEFVRQPVMDWGVGVTIDRRSALMDSLKLKEIEAGS